MKKELLKKSVIDKLWKIFGNFFMKFMKNYKI